MTDLCLNRRRLLTGLALLPVLTGCGIAPAVPQLYVLRPTLNFAPDLPDRRAQIVVAVPESPQSLDTVRIALSKSATTIDYFANAAWPDRVPLLIQGHLVEAFERSGKIIAVGRDNGALRADYQILLELRNFEASYAGDAQKPRILVRLDAKLVHLPDRAIVGNLVAARDVAVARSDVDGIVTTFNEALGGVLGEIVDWSLRTVPV